MDSKFIRSVKIEKLFGVYTYNVPDTGSLSDAAIIYGDNGVGKSTILRLVFHLLSPAGNRGHRTALFKSDFEFLEVTLSSDAIISARIRRDGDKKTLELAVSENGRKVAYWEYRPREVHSSFDETDIALYISEIGERNIIQSVLVGDSGNTRDVSHGEKSYLEALEKHVPNTFILNADRRLDSDSVSDPSDEVELRRVMRYDEPKRINELVARSREIALSQALSAAARSIVSKAVRGANQGSTNVHSVYGDVLRRLADPKRKASAEVNPKAEELIARLSQIDQMTKDHAKFELATHLSTEEFEQVIRAGDKNRNQLAVDLLTPYVESLEGRLKAIQPTYTLVNLLVEIVNSLLRDKTIAFKLGQGFSIQNARGVKLEPSQLSSGEQQLLLLFCYVITARDKPSVFMIDEPELSLNIKWQRQLVQALLSITEGASVQFIFASHSMELLSQHRERVVQLKPQA